MRRGFVHDRTIIAAGPMRRTPDASTSGQTAQDVEASRTLVTKQAVWPIFLAKRLLLLATLEAFTLEFAREVPRMETSVTKKGQTNIPASIRKRHHIKEGDRLVWLDDGEVIRVVPVPADPLTALRGSGRGEKLVDRLLQNRREDRERGS